MTFSRRSCTRFMVWILSAMAGSLVCIAAFNVVVDPWDVRHWPWEASLEAYKKLGDDPAQKASQFTGGQWQVVFTGASRTELALSPFSPALRGQSAYNLGISGASAFTLFTAAQYALSNDPGLKTLVVELDPSYLREEAHERRAAVNASPFNPAMERLPWSMRLLSSGQITRQSFRTLDFALRGRKVGAPHGFFGYGEENDKTPHALFALRQWGVPGMDSVRAPEGAFDLYRADALLPLAQNCRAHGVRLVVFIPPAHAVRLAGLASFGDWQDLKAFKTRLALLAEQGGFEAYDFMGCGDWATEDISDAPGARMTWYYEPIHFRREMGDRLLERMLGPAAQDEALPGGFGVRLRPANMEAHLQAVDHALAVYVKGRPGLGGLLPTEGLAARLEQPAK